MMNAQALQADIQLWGQALGFQQVGFADIDLHQHESYLNRWLEQGFSADMDYMSKHGTKRTRPDELEPGTMSVISVRMDYLPEDAQFASTLEDKNKAYISRYAVGRDYHKLMRKRLQQLATKIQQAVTDTQYRVFVDSAPVMERALAEKSGLGWIGKNTMVINAEAGSWFFLGEIYTNIDFKSDSKTPENQCGQCQSCIKACPTAAIVGPYQVDARRCISYLTIENKEHIPVEFRQAMGNRIYGCDDCQLVCPFNRYSEVTQEPDFSFRHQLDSTSLLALFDWTETDFLQRFEGSPIRRIGYDAWLRNIAVALGNASPSNDIMQSLQSKITDNPMVKEHIDWAIQQQQSKAQVSIPIRTINAVKKMLPRDA
jgi:epoxyqueuosine reductase